MITRCPPACSRCHTYGKHAIEMIRGGKQGAPEAVADLCHLDSAQFAALDAQINALAAQGMRVLGVAKAGYSGREWPDIQHDFDFEFIGLIGLADPVRPTVTAALGSAIQPAYAW